MNIYPDMYCIKAEVYDCGLTLQETHKVKAGEEMSENESVMVWHIGYRTPHAGNESEK